MAYVDLQEPMGVQTTSKLEKVLRKYREAEILRDNWKHKYEEAYEYTMPQRESFFKLRS